MVDTRSRYGYPHLSGNRRHAHSNKEDPVKRNLTPFTPYAIVIAAVSILSLGVYFVGYKTAKPHRDRATSTEAVRLLDRTTVPSDTFVHPVTPPPQEPCDAADDDCGSALGAAPPTTTGLGCKIYHGDLVTVVETSKTMVVLSYTPVVPSDESYRCAADTLYIESRNVFADYPADYERVRARRAEEAELRGRIERDGVPPRTDTR